MAGTEIKAYKKIVWILHDMGKERIEGYEVGDKIYSPSSEIVVGDNITEWFLSFYPGGTDKESEDSIGLYLRLDDSDTMEFKVEYVLGIVGKENETSKEGVKLGASFKDHGWGFNNFLKREELCDPNNEFLTDGKLTLFCKLTITATEISESDKAATLNHGLLNHLKGMLEDEVFADFGIKTQDGQILKAHKSILAVRSSVFKEFLTSDTSSVEENVLGVPEEASVMKIILRFIYCNEVNSENLKEIASKLIVAAEKYELKELKKLCVNSLIASLTPGNVLQTLQIADELTKMKKLKDNCFEMIDNNIHEVSSTDEWEKLPKQVHLEFIAYMANKRQNIIQIKGIKV